MSNTEAGSELKSAMTMLGEAHTLLAKTKLPPSEYNPISGLLAKAKVELFNFYQKGKCDHEWVSSVAYKGAKICTKCSMIK